LICLITEIKTQEDKMTKNPIRIVVLIGFGILQFSLLPSYDARRAEIEIFASALEAGPLAKGGPPPWAPAHGYRAKHRYRYYPSFYVYFDVGRKLYFYLEGDSWRVSARLPIGIHLEYAQYVSIELETDRPFEFFSEHRKKYPPGQAKKKKKHKLK
jgi:hypothetical protein